MTQIRQLCHWVRNKYCSDGPIRGSELGEVIRELLSRVEQLEEKVWKDKEIE